MSDTCEERIGVYMANALEDLRKARFQYGYECEACGHEWSGNEERVYECPECESDDLDSHDARDRYMEGVLEVSPLHIVYRVGLSYGGPADGFYLYVDPEDRTIDRVEYYFQDWFDGAERVLTGDKFDVVCGMFEPYIEIAEYERTHK